MRKTIQSWRVSISARTVLRYLTSRLPETIEYDDLAQICIGMHVYTDGIPEEIASLLLPAVQARAFAAFVRRNFDGEYGRPYWPKYGVFLHDPREHGHWIEVIASLVKKGDTLDAEREAELRRGFLVQRDKRVP